MNIIGDDKYALPVPFFDMTWLSLWDNKMRFGIHRSTVRGLGFPKASAISSEIRAVLLNREAQINTLETTV
jgi:hypothetical protein